jgi:hypothetical protein
VSSLLDGFSVVPLQQKDAAVQTRADAFFKSVGVEKPWRHPAVKWLGLVKDGVIALVVSIYARPDDAIEVLDFYPAPTRDGVKAGYVGLRMLKMLVDEKIIPFWIGGIVAANKKGQRRAERYFGIKPIAIVFQYGGKT